MVPAASMRTVRPARAHPSPTSRAARRCSRREIEPGELVRLGADRGQRLDHGLGPLADRLASAASCHDPVLEAEGDDAADLLQRRRELDLRRVADPLLEGGEDLVLVGAPDGQDEGKAEALAVGRVELGEAGEFLRRQPVEAGARLLAPRVRRSGRRRSPRVRQGRDGRAAAPRCRPALASPIAAWKASIIAARLGKGPPRRGGSATHGECSAMSPKAATKAASSMRVDGVEGDREVGHGPRNAPVTRACSTGSPGTRQACWRSSSVMPVSLPSGMASPFTACARIWSLCASTSSIEARITPFGGASKPSWLGRGEWHMTQCLPTIASTSPSLTVEPRHVELPRRGQPDRRRRAPTAITGSVQPDLRKRVAGVVAVEEVADRAADDDDQRHHQPGLRVAGEHRIVAAHHHHQDGQRQVVVVDRALLADGAERRVGRSAGDQRGDDLLLVGDDDAEDVDRHDRADEGADMDEARRGRRRRGCRHQAATTMSTKTTTASSVVLRPMRRLAEPVVDQPAGAEAEHRDDDRLRRQERQHRRVDQEGVGASSSTGR